MHSVGREFQILAVQGNIEGTPPFLQGGGSLSLKPNFQKGGAWQDLKL